MNGLLRRFAPRNDGLIRNRNDRSTRTRNAELQRHCEERSDEAIHDNGV